MQLFTRKAELLDIKKIIDSPKSELVYLWGRRRVGKSWILNELHQQVRSFFFSGANDASLEATIESFIVAWSNFSANRDLLELQFRYLTWGRIFAVEDKNPSQKNYLKTNKVSETPYLSRL